MSTLRWGILGVGQISHDFCTALQSLDFKDSNGKHRIVAIGSRNLERSKEFADKFNIPRAYGSYEEVANDSHVEIVYIANLNNLHYEACLQILKHSKHIVCEKPFALNYHESEQIIKLAKEKGVFIMEGVWSRFFPVYKFLKNLINEENLKIDEIHIQQGFEGQNVDRVSKKEMGGGIVLDIGVYAIQFALLLFGDGKSLPKVDVKKSKVNEDGVDMYFEADLIFNDDRIAHIKCSGLEELDNKAIIGTNKGFIKIPNYWCPTELITYDNKVKRFPLPELTEGKYVHFINSLGLRYEADEVQRCLRDGLLACDLIPPKETLLIAQIQDEIRKQIKNTETFAISC